MSALSYVVSLIPPEIVRELELARHGYKIYPQNGYFVPYRDGRSLQLPDNDRARRHAQIAQFSRCRRRRVRAMGRVARKARRRARPAARDDPAAPRFVATARSPRPGAARVDACAGSASSGVGDVTRLFTASIADLLDEWFTSPQMQGVLSVSGVIGTWAGPRSPGTAYVMAHHKIGDAGEGQLGSWGFPEGGMGAVSDALRARRPRQRRDRAHRRAGRAHRRARRPGSRRDARVRRGAPRRRRGRRDASEDHVPRPDRPQLPSPPTSSPRSSVGRREAER